MGDELPPGPQTPPPWWKAGWFERLALKVASGALLAVSVAVSNVPVRTLLQLVSQGLEQSAGRVPDDPPASAYYEHNAGVYQKPALPPCPTATGDHPTVWLTTGSVCSCMPDGGWRSTYDAGVDGCG